eukprot:7968722-Pyramimonas_sp.AAC.1
MGRPPRNRWAWVLARRALGLNADDGLGRRTPPCALGGRSLLRDLVVAPAVVAVRPLTVEALQLDALVPRVVQLLR